jgi:hypothetical protein
MINTEQELNLRQKDQTVCGEQAVGLVLMV